MPTVMPTVDPTVQPSQSPIPCSCCLEELAAAKEACEQQIVLEIQNTVADIQSTCEYEGVAICDGGGSVSYEDCEVYELLSVQGDLQSITSNMATYDSCSSTKTQVMSDVDAANDALTELYDYLTTGELAAWQAVYNTYSIDCQFIPINYCNSVVDGSGDQVCTADSGVCADL